MKDSVLFIGLGNPMRGDDGIGWYLADQLAANGYSSTVHRDDFTLLLDDFKTHKKVIIIDAMRESSMELGSHCLIDAHNFNEIPAGSTTHSMSLQQVFELAQVMDCLPQDLKIYAVNGKSFEMGKSLSPGLKLDQHLKNLEELCTS